MKNFLLVLIPFFFSLFFFNVQYLLKAFLVSCFCRFLFSTVIHRFFFHSLCIFKIICLLTYFWLHWVFAAPQAFSLSAVEAGLLSSCGVWASHYGSSSCCRASALGHLGFSSSPSISISSISLFAAEAGLLSSCGVWASHYGSSSCCRASTLGHLGFSSCGTGTQ